MLLNGKLVFNISCISALMKSFKECVGKCVFFNGVFLFGVSVVCEMCSPCVLLSLIRDIAGYCMITE